MARALIGPIALPKSGGHAASSTVPAIVYGSSHHGDINDPYVIYKALQSGFRGIDAAPRI